MEKWSSSYLTKEGLTVQQISTLWSHALFMCITSMKGWTIWVYLSSLDWAEHRGHLCYFYFFVVVHNILDKHFIKFLSHPGVKLKECNAMKISRERICSLRTVLVLPCHAFFFFLFLHFSHMHSVKNWSSHATQHSLWALWLYSGLIWSSVKQGVIHSSPREWRMYWLSFSISDCDRIIKEKLWVSNLDWCSPRVKSNNLTQRLS